MAQKEPLVPQPIGAEAAPAVPEIYPIAVPAEPRFPIFRSLEKPVESLLVSSGVDWPLYNPLNPPQRPSFRPFDSVTVIPNESIQAALRVASMRLSAFAPTAFQPTADLDPKLLRMMTRRALGVSKPAAASADVDEVAVFARISDLEAWEALSEVRVGESVRSASGDWLVTARIPLVRVGDLQQLSFVKDLKPARPVRGNLTYTRADTKADPIKFPPGVDPAGGAGVVIGVVDFGCDFAHPNFRNPDGTTRLECLWNQAGQVPAGVNPVKYGCLHLRDEINEALKSTDPYAALSYRPALRSHGTHVTDIAAGSGASPGIAPQASIIFVELSTSELSMSKPEANFNLGDSVLLWEALRFIFNQAGDRPCVINLSLGTNGGSHDGDTLVELAIDDLCREKPNRAVVISAGNAYSNSCHIDGEIPAGGTIDIPWNTPGSDLTSNEVEIWLSETVQVDLEIILPSGDTAFTVEPGRHEGTYDAAGRLELHAANICTPGKGPTNLNVWMSGKVSGGQWILRVRRRDTQPTPVTFHAWIERDDISPSKFPNANPDFTLCSISCGYESIVVAAYDAHKPALPASWFSSAGPTRDGRDKPELSAPGQAVYAASAMSGGLLTDMSGTSMAAPAVTGAVALAFAEALRRRVALNSSDLRACLKRSCRPLPGGAWDRRLGYGRLAVDRLLSEIAGLGPAPATPMANLSAAVPAAPTGPVKPKPAVAKKAPVAKKAAKPAQGAVKKTQRKAAKPRMRP